MRRGFALLALLVAFALPGCGGGEESPPPAGNENEPASTEKKPDYGY